MTKGHRIDPDMPWGWWLIRDGATVRDDDGRTWPSVTAALEDHLWPKSGWRGSPQGMDDLLLRTLEVIDEDGRFYVAAREQLFGGNKEWSDWFACWLVEVGLAQKGENHFNPLVLSDLGRSVLLMLRHVRTEDRHTLWMREIRMETSATSTVSERTLARVDEIQSRWPPRANKVLRDSIGKQFVIKISHFDRFAKDTGGMPISRVVWSMSFRDAELRDHFYAWMCAHSMHWDRWGELAHNRGARALTERIFGIILAESASHGESWLRTGDAHAAAD